jgi:hypothetical protein
VSATPSTTTSTGTPSTTTSTGIVQTSCWATMDKDMLQLIAQHVLSGDFMDHAAFRAVCKHWRSSSVCPTGHSITDPSFHPRNWMMFPEGHGLYPGNPKLEGHVRFINLSTGAFARPFLPIFHDHCALDSVNGVLLLQRDHDSTIRLLHPFTGEMADLPRLTTLLPQLNIAADDDRKLAHFRAICASVSINDATRVVTVMLALRKLGNLAVATATSSDQHWSLFEWKDLQTHSMPLSFQGKLYVMVQQGNDLDIQLLRIDQPERVSSTTMKLVATCLMENIYLPLCMAECDGDILVLCYTDQSLTPLSLYKLVDLMLKRFVPVTSIRDKSLYIDERSLCVSAKTSPSIVANTVIFFHPRERRLATYYLSSGNTTMDDGGFLDAYPVFHAPCSFIHHIFTCCRHAFW